MSLKRKNQPNGQSLVQSLLTISDLKSRRSTKRKTSSKLLSINFLTILKEDTCIKIQEWAVEILFNQYNNTLSGKGLKRRTIERWRKSRRAFFNLNRSILSMMRPFLGSKAKIYL